MSRLFEPAFIGSMRLPNRIVRSATAERMSNEAGIPLAPMTSLYERLARGGAGLLISGHMSVDPAGKAHPAMTGIHGEPHVAALRQVVAAVHLHGGRIAAQISHAGMLSAGEVETPFAPSAIHRPPAGRPARGMTSQEIEATISTFAQAARHAVAAGFDAVQIHSAHGYLGSQFLSPLVNRRRDGWGGSIRARMAFLRQVCRNVRDAVGAGFPILVKLGVVDEFEGGLELSDSLEVLASLSSWGVDAVEISGGLSSARTFNIRPVRSAQDEGYFRPFAQLARDRTDLPILLVGGLRSRSVMEEILQSGDADFISLSRPLLCEPDLPLRFAAGGQQAASCISGNRCWPEAETDFGIACKCLSHRPIGGARPS